MENRILWIVFHNLVSKKNAKIARQGFPHHATTGVILTVLGGKNDHNSVNFFWRSKLSGKLYSGDRFS